MIRIREDELIENRWECHSEGRSALCFAFHGGALGAWKKEGPELVGPSQVSPEATTAVVSKVYHNILSSTIP